MKTIYSQAVEKIPSSEIGSHQSDLYLKQTDESDKLIKNYEFKSNVTIFRCQTDGSPWYEIPFAYDPFWSKLNRQ